ncbi:MAG: imidazole glycerol phosphate synthase subunit HisH, partial [Alphaproteobacteria bacterium]
DNCGAEVVVTGDPNKVREATHLVLPGVGAFGDCMAALRRHRLIEAVMDFLKRQRPFLGICVGMQMLFELSEEFGEHAGLGVIAGRVRKLPAADSDGRPLKVPLIGWSDLVPSADWRGTLFASVQPGSACYFVHSFVGAPERPENRLADCEYGGHRLCAAVRHGSIYGTQFHPEKSGPVGLQILAAFCAA